MAYYNKFPGLLTLNSLHPYTKTYIAAMTTPPSPARARLYDKIVRGLVGNNIWNDLDLFYINANFDNQSSRLNLINPSYATLTALGTASFTTDRGWTGGASGANNLTNGVDLNSMSKLSLNSAHLGIYSRANIGTMQRLASAAGASGPFLTITRHSATEVYGWANQGDTSPVTSGVLASTTGYIVVNRSGSAAQQLYKDGVSIGSNTASSSSIPAGALYAPGYENASNASQFSILHAGSSLTSGKVAIINNLITNYLTAVGAI